MKQTSRLKVLLLWAMAVSLASLSYAATQKPNFRNNDARYNQIQQRQNSRYINNHVTRTPFRESKLILVSTLDGSIIAMDKFENFVYWTLKGGPNGELLKTASYFHSDNAIQDSNTKFEEDIFADTVVDDYEDYDDTDMWNDLPSDIAPLVEMGEEDNTQPPNDIVYIVEPKDNGTIYVYENGKRLTVRTSVKESVKVLI